MAEGGLSKQNGDKRVAVNVRLKTTEQTDQPFLVNYTQVGLAEGLAYVDFGFLEPALLGAVVKRAKQGETVPKQLEGIRAARVALPLDSVARLYQQLQQVLLGLQSQQPKHS